MVAQPVTLPGGAVTTASSGGSVADSSSSLATAPKYTVQICVSNDIGATDRLVADLKDGGYDAFYRKHTTRTGRELYFVYVGQFVTREEANIAMRHYRTVDGLKKYNDKCQSASSKESQ